ncbi:MAG TPA: TldD/PmbA family protein [Blastocatellia bacterium]|nr:TldD/PmbA family protein [Blastocatellia bacterium]
MITKELLHDIIKQAVKHGATEAEATGVESTEFHVEVRLGEVEKLQEAASRGIGLRVLYQGRQASCSTSDLSPQAVDELISSTVEMAKLTSVDDAAALPYGDELAREVADLGLYDPSISALTTERKIEMARSAEEAARGADARITNSEGSACSTATSKTLLVNSAGFAGEYQGTSCALTVAPIAKENGQMQVAVWGDRQRALGSLDSPETLGLEAARRALRKLNASKVRTQEAPIVFESSVAEELLSDFFAAVDGYSIFRRASFLVGRLGEMIAAPALTVIDDGRMRGAVGSRPFDGEGLATRQTVVVENGVLKNYLLNTYTARKLGLRSTASAIRSLTGAPVVGFSNFFIAPGVYKADEIIASVKNGFYVTEMIGFGFNAVTGDFSRGASGWWIEDGKLAFPVEEVTVAGNFRDMLRGIEMIGNDLRFRGRVAAPTIKIDRMMVSGE